MDEASLEQFLRTNGFVRNELDEWVRGRLCVVINAAAGLARVTETGAGWVQITLSLSAAHDWVVEKVLRE